MFDRVYIIKVLKQALAEITSTGIRGATQTNQYKALLHATDMFIKRNILTGEDSICAWNIHTITRLTPNQDFVIVVIEKTTNTFASLVKGHEPIP